MSLWYESFITELYSIDKYYGINSKAKSSIQKQQAKCILAYLSMEVPRNYWESALQSGIIDKDHANVILNSIKELQKLPDINVQIDPALLVSLSFIDDLKDNKMARYGDCRSKYSLNDYFKNGQKVLQEHPELYKLGDMIMNNQGNE